MGKRDNPVRRSPSACGVFLVGILALVHSATVAPARDRDIALQCRFASGLEAIYLVNRAGARVRRADLLQPRHGRLRGTKTEYRFDFRDFSEAYRIEVIIDRSTGNTRRVFGTRDRMGRMPDMDRGVTGLVHDVGQCREQAGSRGALLGGETP